MGKAHKSPDEMTFLEHLEDLRKRLWFSFLAIIIGFVPAWVFSKDLYEILARPLTKYLPEGTTLVFTNLPDPFFVYIKISFIAALFVTSPFIFLQIWYFVAPGLFKKEKKYVIPFVIFTTIFFSTGAFFGYKVVFPFACRFFLQIGTDFTPMITVNQYFTLAIRILLGIAVVFELPTLVFFLARMGILTSRFMVKNFKYAVLIAFIIAAVITPTPDMITQSIIAIPMLGLYGLSILIALVFGKNEKRKRTDDDKGPIE
ncbi:MAG: twin-arginine translocase subunit TatC [Acidobacteria bacterium]|nr:twin-arginine translocase subunit TatC [Acidobacteriota bacterium]MCG2817188.1 twin-arginine translocase subunit TatC [Candidatus Aminicenantes bacterium]MBU1339886.1 twin-arginine translocase subunit TatC [Acidobacteriota bacterium]MBU1475337.1 twin-arginine translocase subunit TatC [Acidobacteriota bacterium]MBU4203140.1 twin-arginine translocase subunit TatC [Acidobacteriota bacterium]